MTLTRRQFHASAMAVLSAAAAKATPLGQPIGCQIYPVREALVKDFDGTLRELSGIGFKQIEMCSPPGYGFKPLMEMSPGDMKAKIQAAGLMCHSCHFGMREFRESLDARIAWAKALGLTQMVISSFGLPATATLADWKGAAEQANKFGESTKKAGLQLGYHNHDGEFKELEGKLIYDELLKTMDPALVKMQFQVSVAHLGFQAADYMTKYPGRFLSLHLQDWSPEEKKQVAVGSGMVDWKKLFGAAKKGGVKNYFVELNLDQMKPSCEYLQKL